MGMCWLSFFGLGGVGSDRKMVCWVNLYEIYIIGFIWDLYELLLGCFKLVVFGFE
jgi:hypothetical protein